MEMLTHAGGDTTLENNSVLQIPLQVHYLKDLLHGPQGSCTRIFKMEATLSIGQRIGTVWNIHIFVYYQLKVNEL